MKDFLPGRSLPLLSYEATTSLLSRGNFPLQFSFQQSIYTLVSMVRNTLSQLLC